MLPVLLYGMNQTERNDLLKTLQNTAKEKHISVQVQMVSDDPEEIEDTLKEVNGISLVVLEAKGNNGKLNHSVIELGRQAIQTNRDNYLVYVLENGGLLEQAVSICSHPFGILVKPPKMEMMEIIFKRLIDEYSDIIQEKTDDGKHLVIQTGGFHQRIKYDSILYIEALDKKLQIYQEAQVLTVYITMNDLESQLGNVFFRCHRSYMVNKSRIQSIDFPGMEVKLTSGERIPLARTRKSDAKEMLKNLGGQ